MSYAAGHADQLWYNVGDHTKVQIPEVEIIAGHNRDCPHPFPSCHFFSLLPLAFKHAQVSLISKKRPTSHSSFILPISQLLQIIVQIHLSYLPAPYSLTYCNVVSDTDYGMDWLLPGPPIGFWSLPNLTSWQLVTCCFHLPPCLLWLAASK